MQENTTTDCYGEFWPEWFEARAKDSDIEYIRTDAFIEKTWNWIEDNILSSNQQDKSDNIMAKTIKKIAQEKTQFIPANVYGFNMTFLRSEVAKACEETANDVLTKVEEIVYRKHGGKIHDLQLLILELKGY